MRVLVLISHLQTVDLGIAFVFVSPGTRLGQLPGYCSSTIHVRTFTTTTTISIHLVIGK